MDYFLVIAFSVVFAFFISCLDRFRFPFKNKMVWPLIFLAKVATGCFYGWFHLNIYGGGDTWDYFWDSQIMTATLWENPFHFLRLAFGPSGGEIPPHLWKPITDMGFWNNPDAWFMVRLHAVLNIFSGERYYVNLIFFNLLSLAGLRLLAGVFFKNHSNPSSLFVSLILFFPSYFFWSSGVHKELIMVPALGLVLTGFDRLVIDRAKETGSKILATFFLLFGLFLIFQIRVYYLYLLLPGLLALTWASLQPGKALMKFAFIYLGCSVLFQIINLPFFGENLLQVVINKQTEFAGLRTGNSGIPLAAIDFSLSGLLKVVPQAFLNVLIRPLPSDCTAWIHYIALIDNLTLGVLGIIGSWFWIKSNNRPGTLHWFGLFFAFSAFLAIGLVVPNAGAIFRYKSVATPFFLYFFLGNWPEKFKLK